MTRTFLITLNLPDDGSLSLEDVAFDIEDALQAAGIDFEEVKVWSSPGAAALPSVFTTPPTPPPPTL